MLSYTVTDDDRTALRVRLADYHVIRHNDWPDSLLTDITVVSPHFVGATLYRAGQFANFSQPALRNVTLADRNRIADMLEVHQALDTISIRRWREEENHGLISAYWMLPFPGGQEIITGDRDIIAVWEARTVPEPRFVTFRFGTCAHKYEQTRLGNAYNEYRCVICGATYRVDSSG
jgi:hypothetical protein